ncbi:SICA antigen [Plasmodium coatneyi]|uniref:SICA antigen n=1 Tax=Plasmodium coatneyi TaxID=208452 RepID=A0A1B1DUP8_9APIC|nr:SICA antigen [Plasmodium coatneyi]ANQ06464.1 SICA antigen [Plasmodium coatneyi]
MQSDVWLDFPNILQNLSKAITTESIEVDSLCEGIEQVPNGKEDANKKACQLIVRGLKHLYSIQESHIPNVQDHPFLNQQFKQFAICLLLKQFAKKLKEQSKCEVEEGMKKAFESSTKIKGEKCTKNTYECVECKREDDYSSCPMGGQQIGDKLKKLLDQNKNGKKQDVKQALDAIDNICKVSVPPAKVPEVPKEVVPEKNFPAPVPKAEEAQPQLPESSPAPAAPPAAPASEEKTSITEKKGKNVDSELGGVVTPPAPAALRNPIDPSNLTSYLPLAPAVLGISAMTYLLWKYFGMFRKTRKRYRRAPQIRGPSLEQQIVDHVNEDVPHAYTIVKERKGPRSVPTRRKHVGKHAGRRRGVRRRMIIDIHLEVLDECQKGDLHSMKEDFFEIIVQEFMGSNFIKEEKVPNSDSGFREGRLCS